MPSPEPTPRLDVARLTVIRPPFLVAGIVALSLLVVFVDLPGRPLILHVLQKLGHPAVFGFIALGVFVLARQRRPRAPPWLDYVLAFVIATAIGGVTELGQIFTHRDPSLRDVGLDARGAACVLLVVAAFDIRCRSGRYGGRWRTMYFVVAAVLAAIILMPLAWTGAGYALRRYRFPVLVEPATRLDQLFLTASGQRLERVTVPAALAREPGEMALRIPLVARPYAGITIDEPSPDWTGYRSLAVDVTNPGRTPLLLEVRVHDRAHNYTYADRFNAEISVAPGRRETIEFALEAIRAAPAGRSLDLRHVANVTLFRSAPGGPREFWLHRIELR